MALASSIDKSISFLRRLSCTPIQNSAKDLSFIPMYRFSLRSTKYVNESLRGYDCIASLEI